MFDFWREATTASVPGFLRQSGRRRPERVSVLSSLLLRGENDLKQSDEFQATLLIRWIKIITELSRARIARLRSTMGKKIW